MNEPNAEGPAAVRAWESVRGRLARLFGRVTLHELPPGIAGGDELAHCGAVTEWTPPAPGTLAQGWPLSADAHLWRGPAAEAGGGGANLAAVPCGVSGNAVPHLEPENIRDSGSVLSAATVQNADMGTWDAGKMPSVSLAMAGGEMRAAVVAIAAGKMRAVPVSVAPAGGQRRNVAVSLPLPKVQERLTLVFHLPMCVRRAAADEEHRRRLAVSCGAAIDDVALLGAYAHVPLARVQQMAVADGGAVLRVWLRSVGKSGRALGLVTVVLGRRRSTGEALRAVVPETGELPGRPKT